jgi:hypothetical protein
VLRLLRRLQRELGIGMIFVTHDLARHPYKGRATWAIASNGNFAAARHRMARQNTLYVGIAALTAVAPVLL